jgi:hypothetical protein
MDYSIINKLIDQFKIDNPYDDIEVYIFPQVWGSTALGYGGFGGQAITTAETIVLHAQDENLVRVYFGGSRLAYQIKNPNQKFFEDLYAQRLVEVCKAGKYRRED